MAEPTAHTNEASAKAVVPSTCPPGMEPLLDTSEIIFLRRKEWLEAYLGSSNTSCYYEILDKDGRRKFIAKEERSLLRSFCLGGNRPFTIYIFNSYGRKCLLIERHCFWNTVKIYGSDGYFGKIDHDRGFKFTIYDSDDRAALKIHEPCCCVCCCVTDQFSILDINGSVIGMIYWKEMDTYLKDSSTKADIFRMNFPQQLDFRLKTLLIGALVLIDFMYFHLR